MSIYIMIDDSINLILRLSDYLLTPNYQLTKNGTTPLLSEHTGITRTDY